MSNDTITLQVKVRLDPTPGVMHTPESARDVVAMLLTRNMASYNPEVALIADDGIEVHPTINLGNVSGFARVGDYIFVGGDLTVARAFTQHAPGHHPADAGIVPELIVLAVHTDFGTRYRGVTSCTISPDGENVKWDYTSQTHTEMAGSMYAERGDAMYSAETIDRQNVVSRGAW